MKFELRPYTEIDGIRTFRDSFIKGLWNRTVADGLDKVVFYEETVSSSDQFLLLARKGGIVFWALFDDGNCIGYVWLNRFENRSARLHFCVFKEYWGKSINIGIFTLRTILSMENQDGGKILSVITGIVPEWNKRAIKFALKCGGKTHGVIPHYIKEGEGAMLIYYTGDDHD